ncbi:ABC transporter permease [Pseudooceanicola nanhaiensis]|uniref:ABC transporter permease n=1 Tax=Pseudooceanicola nanhaiensis TaxID=375761 RepID=UPI001CD55EC6|nr:ABC transporter permease [Pseudooceanicola nanhaiensis]MCA0921289.1 ABC transporter permease [Pseudooceanicola nanhaiensis]
MSSDAAIVETDAAEGLPPSARPSGRPSGRPSSGSWELQRRRLTLALMALPMICMALFFLAPLFTLLWMSFGGWSGEGFTLVHFRGVVEPVYLRLLYFTLRLAFFTTLACALLAYPIAYLMVNLPGRYAQAMAITLFISLWLSFLARTFAWIIILQRNGVVNTILQTVGITSGPLELVYNEVGVYIGMIHILLPFMVITLIPSMKAIDPAYVRAALSLGAKPFQVFYQVYVPLSLPGLVAGSMLVFTLAFGFFVTPAILGGGRTPTIVLAVRDQIQKLGDLELAAATSMVLLLICLVLLLIYDRIAGVDKLFDKGR